MQIALKNKKKVAINSPRSVVERKNKVEGGTLSSRVKREHESTYLRAHKMMRGKVEPFAMPIVVRVMPTTVQVVRQTTVVPHMTSPHEKQPKEKR